MLIEIIMLIIGVYLFIGFIVSALIYRFSDKLPECIKGMDIHCKSDAITCTFFGLYL